MSSLLHSEARSAGRFQHGPHVTLACVENLHMAPLTLNSGANEGTAGVSSWHVMTKIGFSTGAC